MRTLSAAGILEAWERGSSQVPAEQALMLLAAACPERTGDELAALPLGARDALLLTARQRLFGAELTSFARCPVCASALEFTAQVDDLRAGPRVDETPSAVSPPFHTTMLPVGSDVPATQVTYRLPTGGDLIALQDISEPAAFRLALAKPGCDGLEFDLRLSADGLAVVLHDGTPAVELAAGHHELAGAFDWPSLPDARHGRRLLLSLRAARRRRSGSHPSPLPPPSPTRARRRSPGISLISSMQ